MCVCVWGGRDRISLCNQATKLLSNLQQSPCLCYLSDGIISVCDHAWRRTQLDKDPDPQLLPVTSFCFPAKVEESQAVVVHGFNPRTPETRQRRRQRQRQMDICDFFLGQSGLHNEFQDSQDTQQDSVSKKNSQLTIWFSTLINIFDFITLITKNATSHEHSPKCQINRSFQKSLEIVLIPSQNSLNNL